MTDEGYEQFLRRALEASRRDKGDDHKQTLSHPARPSGSFEKAGGSKEVRALINEHYRVLAEAHALVDSLRAASLATTAALMCQA